MAGLVNQEVAGLGRALESGSIAWNWELEEESE